MKVRKGNRAYRLVVLYFKLDVPLCEASQDHDFPPIYVFFWLGHCPLQLIFHCVPCKRFQDLQCMYFSRCVNFTCIYGNKYTQNMDLKSGYVCILERLRYPKRINSYHKVSKQTFSGCPSRQHSYLKLSVMLHLHYILTSLFRILGIDEQALFWSADPPIFHKFLTPQRSVQNCYTVNILG